MPEQSLLDMGFREDEVGSLEVYGPSEDGCEKCGGDGYKGRVGIYEVVQITPEVSRIIMEDGNSIQIDDAFREAGFNNLRESGLEKVRQGVTSLAEVNRVTTN